MDGAIEELTSEGRSWTSFAGARSTPFATLSGGCVLARWFDMEEMPLRGRRHAAAAVDGVMHRAPRRVAGREQDIFHMPGGQVATPCHRITATATLRVNGDPTPPLPGKTAHMTLTP